MSSTSACKKTITYSVKRLLKHRRRPNTPRISGGAPNEEMILGRRRGEQIARRLPIDPYSQRCVYMAQVGRPRFLVQPLCKFDPIWVEDFEEYAKRFQGRVARGEADGACTKRSQLAESVLPKRLQLQTYCFSPSFTKASRAWNMLRLFTYCMSPFWNSVLTQNLSPTKCKVSKASACASVIGGMSGLRGNAPNPTKYRRPYCRDTL